MYSWRHEIHHKKITFYASYTTALKTYIPQFHTLGLIYDVCRLTFHNNENPPRAIFFDVSVCPLEVCPINQMEIVSDMGPRYTRLDTCRMYAHHSWLNFKCYIA